MQLCYLYVFSEINECLISINTNIEYFSLKDIDNKGPWCFVVSTHLDFS